MNALNPIPITITETKDIQSALFDLVRTFPELPEQVETGGIFFEQLNPRKVCMCISTIAHPYRTKTYLDGSYTSRYGFRLILQTMDVSNIERINSQAVLSKIGEWFECNTLVKTDGTTYRLEEYPEMHDKRKITKVYKNTVPKLAQRLPPNIEITEATFVAEYYTPTEF